MEDYLNGGARELIGEYMEVETGKGSDALARRPQLREALAFLQKAQGNSTGGEAGQAGPKRGLCLGADGKQG